MRTKINLLLMFIFIGGLCFSQTNEDWYQDKPIRGIVYRGLHSINRTELDGLFTSYIGKPFNDERYWEILQKLYALEYFSEITPVALPGDELRETVQLEFTVVEKPIIKKLVFIGNKQIRASALLEQITLKEGDIYQELKSKMDERAIRDHYFAEGYANMKITSEVVINNDNSVNLQFSIEEGKKTVISELLFEGNRVMASKTLKKELSLKETKFFTKGTFSEAALVADKIAVMQYYTSRGYIDATVESVLREVDTESDPDKNLLKLTFIIKEGEQYTYGGTSITGNTLFTTENLLSKLRIAKGDVMNLPRYSEGYQSLLDVYYENGYTSNYIDQQETRDEERKRISYEITILERDRSHIEHIIIRGNTKTKEHVITREIQMESGDIFSKTKMVDSIRNLYNLRYFSIVAPDIVQGSEQNLVDVIINLEEQSTASIQFGVTFSGMADEESFPLSVFLQWEDTNFSGYGQTLSANVTLSPDTQSATLGFTENWFLGTPLSMSFNFSIAHRYLYAYQDALDPIFGDDYYREHGIVPDPFTSYTSYDDEYSLDSSYRMKFEQWQHSLGASTGYRWNKNFALVTVRGGLMFSIIQNYYDDVLYRPADRDIRDKQGSWKWSNSVWSRLSLDNRDLNYDPSTGWFASQQITFNGIIPSIETEYFVRFETKAERYFTLVDYPVFDTWNFKLVLAGYTSLSFQIPLGDYVITDNSKLYIDGMFSGRGWNELFSKMNTRGNFSIYHWVELRTPIAPGIISADFFFDAVATKPNYNDLSNLTLNDYYFSFGPGLRFSIPQFPLRLLFANTFRIQDGKFEWSNGSGPTWEFVLSFNIANL
ncbi:MAG TPA: outer membrane protein assembly factor BamA [Treponema sp.]|nr:outer membrane protein assembly factor BamA [Treponema sp.]